MTETYEDGDVIIDGKGNFLTYSEDGEDGNNWVGYGGEWCGPMSEIPQPVTRLYTITAEDWKEYQTLKSLRERLQMLSQTERDALWYRLEDRTLLDRTDLQESLAQMLSGDVKRVR